MMMNLKISVVFALLLLIFACNGSDVKLVPLDLLSHGMSLKVSAPEGSIVEFDDIGLISEMTIKANDDHFNIVITSSEADILDMSKLKLSEKEQVESSTYFSQIISEDDRGFIYEKKVSEDYINYDFRYMKIQGDKKYIFKSGLGTQYSLDDVQTMFKAVQ